jgi:sulfite reductase (NADPH) hemoprotein beta-component
LANTGIAQQLTGMRRIAEIHTGDFRLTPNQNVVIANVKSSQKAAIDTLVKQYGLDAYKKLTPLRLHSIACVALPTCGQAMAEAERYLPDLLGKIEALQIKHEIEDQAITIRMTGCPNGCARPYLAEIGLVGKAPGRYNLHLGAAHDGTRLNRMIAENANEATILNSLDQLFELYREQRSDAEYFGDWFIRNGDSFQTKEVQYG